MKKNIEKKLFQKVSKGKLWGGIDVFQLQDFKDDNNHAGKMNSASSRNRKEDGYRQKRTKKQKLGE